MEFIAKCEALRLKYADNCLVRQNGTVLLGPGSIPRAKHYFYAGASWSHIQKMLIDCYIHPVPKEYIEFLQYSNGVDLFSIRINTTDGLSYALSLLDIWELPWNPPGCRKPDEEEPADIAIEDLARHHQTPKQWLKVGRYYDDVQQGPLELFVDTDTEAVYSCRKNQYPVYEQWNSLDQCLCALFDRLSQVDLDVPLLKHSQAKDPLAYYATGEFYGGPEVDSLIESALKEFPESMGKTKRIKAAKQCLRELFHTTGRKCPYWLEKPNWPMGKNSPMKYLSRKRDGERVIFTFQDVDTGEIREVEQFY